MAKATVIASQIDESDIDVNAELLLALAAVGLDPELEVLLELVVLAGLEGRTGLSQQDVV